MPIVERRRKKLVKAESIWLHGFARTVKSQYGEDGVLEKIFEVIGEGARWCVEFGAWDGELNSNTWNLIHNRNWSGVLIEGNREKFNELCRKFGGNDRVVPVHGYVGWEGEATLDAILKTTPLPQKFDLISIDIDGNDWHVWNALEFYRPRVVLIEFNGVIQNDIVFIQDAGPDVHQGCSLLALIDLGKKKGYELVAVQGSNGFFVERELFPLFGIADNDIDAIYDSKYDIELFHGYDGVFYAAGDLRVGWHGIKIDQCDFQILPKSLRKYGVKFR